MNNAVSLLAVALALVAAPADASQPGSAAMAKYKAAWDSVRTYTCRVTSHEELGARVQDFTYDFSFQKPAKARMDITAGDNKGRAVVYTGGDFLTGRQSGFISFIKLRLNVHDRRVTSMRGATIAQANFGSLYDHLAALKSASRTASRAGKDIVLTIVVASPATDGGITKEVVALGSAGLPVVYDEYQGTQRVKRVTFDDLKLNVPLPPSTFTL